MTSRINDSMHKIAWLDSNTREEIISALWSSTLQSPYLTLLDVDSFVDFYQNQCRYTQHEPQAVTTHSELLKIARQIIRPHLDCTREILRDRLSTEIPILSNRSKQSLDNTIDLAIRLCCMVDCRSAGHKMESPNSLILLDHQSFTDSISKAFPKSLSTSRGSSLLRFPEPFNLKSLNEIGGFRIIWTSNIAEHLLLDGYGRLFVFHHATFLVAARIPGYPDGLEQEALNTLALLIPARTEAPVRRWFMREVKKAAREGLVLDTKASDLPVGRFDVDDFSYFRERLMILGERYAKVEPRTLTQWWRDRRKRVQWATFWTAVLLFFVTIFFGVIQSVASIVQAWASVKALRNSS